MLLTVHFDLLQHQIPITAIKIRQVQTSTNKATFHPDTIPNEQARFLPFLNSISIFYYRYTTTDTKMLQNRLYEVMAKE